MYSNVDKWAPNYISALWDISNKQKYKLSFPKLENLVFWQTYNISCCIKCIKMCRHHYFVKLPLQSTLTMYCTGSIWVRCVFDLGSIWDRCGSDLGSIWGRFGSDSISIWFRFGSDLGPSLIQFYFDFDSNWHRFGSNLYSICVRFGSTWGRQSVVNSCVDTLAGRLRGGRRGTGRWVQGTST